MVVVHQKAPLCPPPHKEAGVRLYSPGATIVAIPTGAEKTCAEILQPTPINAMSRYSFFIKGYFEKSKMKFKIT
jgi:hypothetical protein